MALGGYDTDLKILEALFITTSISSSSYVNFDTLGARLARGLTNIYNGTFSKRVT